MSNLKKYLINLDKSILLVLLTFTGLVLRYWVMSFGYNYDFESYCIVGEIANKFKNVYEYTNRYNYGPLFFNIQGLCYSLASHISNDKILTYRILIVGVLSLADIGIMLYLYKRHSLIKAILFFLNPISIIITGYHNQFDNIAIFLIILSILCFNKEEKFSYKDVGFIVFTSLSLVMKHIMFAFPLWIIIRKDLPIKKKIVYSVVPPFLFLMSFIPYIINNPKAFGGIINNVFLYRSLNNAPLLYRFYTLFSLPNSLWFLCFIIIISIIGFIFRKMNYEYQVLMYLLSLVSFSSAIANQYLVIPLVALCIISPNITIIYTFFIGIYLLLSDAALGLIKYTQIHFSTSVFGYFTNFIYNEGYFLAAFIIFILIIKELIINLRNKNC